LPDDYLRKVVDDGFEHRNQTVFQPMTAAGTLKYLPAKYQERLVLELSVIERMGYAGYFLIVWEFIKFARERGIPVGPGRGSAAGSLVAYCLGITDVDPLQYDLFFERFLNPERVSMPDHRHRFLHPRPAPR
jgi:DNA polymerase-3 subunit alpha